MNSLRSKVIRLAHAQPSLRPHLLPLLTKTAADPDAVYRDASLSEKKVPKALADMAKKVKAKLSAKLVDPSKIDFNFNQFNDYIKKSVVHSAIFFAEFEGEHGRRRVSLVLQCATGADGVQMSLNGSPESPASVNGAVNLFLDAVQGWDNVKGEAEGRAARESTAKAVARALDSVTERLNSYGTYPATVSPDFRTVKGGYRGDLPKGGDYEYEDMMEEEEAHADEALARALSPYKDKIASMSVRLGEKSWIHVTVTLK